MIKRLTILGGSAALLLLAGCGKKSADGESGEKSPAAAEVVMPLPEMASQLGIATKVPKDVDVFVSGYHADEMLMSLIAKVAVDVPSKGKDEELDQVISHMGDEMFLFVGPGAGAQLQMIGTTYRDLTSAWAGFAVGTMLDSMASKDSKPDFSKLADSLSNGLVEKWLDVIEKDSRLRIPSVVMGWRPSPDKESECFQAVGEGMDRLFSNTAGATPVSFEASGVRLVGYDFPGREVFADAIAEGRGKLAEEAGSDELLKQLSPERIERLLAAMEKVRFTIATGVLEGRVVIYFGDGQDGFRLATTPAESIAAIDDLKWIAGFAGKRITNLAYLSGSVVKAALPWLDLSDYWNSVAGAIRPPLKEERLLREILTSLADTGHDLAKRDASAWSAIICEDDGWRYESQGGWPDPSLDYETPLRMTDAALAAKPAIRAQWVQNRGWNDLSWKRLEHFGVLIDSLVGEIEASGNPMIAMVPEGITTRLIKEVQDINHAYRDEFRSGIGNELALVADFEGEMPAIPGISEETVKNGKAPRFIIARPVRDRAKLDAAGKSFAASWRSLTAWASELSGSNLPLILPQSLESNGLVTWYPPMPFIGGDFVPGVTLNDEVWMLGTSRSMAGEFSKYLKTSGAGDEKGMIVEIDFAAVRNWLENLYQQNKAQAGLLADDAPEEMRQLANEENLDLMKSAADRIQGLGYRKWMVGGKPRTSLHLRFNPR